MPVVRSNATLRTLLNREMRSKGVGSREDPNAWLQAGDVTRRRSCSDCFLSASSASPTKVQEQSDRRRVMEDSIWRHKVSMQSEIQGGQYMLRASKVSK